MVTNDDDAGQDERCPLQYTLIRKLLKYIHDDVRFTLTRYGLDDRPRPMMMMMMVPVRERLSIHAILNARLMEYFKDVLLGPSFRERLWVIVESNIAYNDIVPWLRANRCPRVYTVATLKTANEYGIFRYNNDCYEGGWKEGKRHGQGKYTWANGSIYGGGWKDGQKGNRHGHGKQIYPDGNVYEGRWKNNQRHGYGKLTYSDGQCYIGDFEDNKIQGSGTFTYSDGRVYNGDFVNNHFLM